MARQHTIRGAFAFLEDGEKARRVSWPEGRLLKMADGMIGVYDEGAWERWAPRHDDIVAKDWEMV